MAKIEHQQEGKNGTFYIEQQGNRIGESLYSMDGNEINIYHTEVDGQFQGKHIGDQLIAGAVDYARKNNLKILPTCTFAQAEFRRHKDYDDVLANK